MTTLRIRRLVYQLAKARLVEANQTGEQKSEAMATINKARANFRRQIRFVEAYLGREHRV